MMLDTLGSLLVYALLASGLGWPFATRLSASHSERLLAATCLSLVAVFLAAWAVYVLALPRAIFWALPALAFAGLALNRRSLQVAWRDLAARDLILAQALVTGWSVGWLALVVTYSGGGWTGDWFGHWQRMMFFLEHGPRNILFNGFDPLTSRPPFANVVLGAFVSVTRTDFAHYQLAMTFLGSLAFLPAALLARRFAGRSVTALLTVLFMLSPLWVQNSTFAWTKLPAAFFTLAAVHYLLRTGETEVRGAGRLCAITLAAALLTHYSAGPYAVIIACGWIARGWARRGEGTWWRETAGAAAAGAVMLATWFGWALAVYGSRGTFLTNTSVTEQAPAAAAQLATVAMNLRDTLVPHFLRNVDYGFIAQVSPWGWWRDWFFLLYQVNLLFAFGSVAWIALLVVLVRSGRGVPTGLRAGWLVAIAATVFLGVAVHAARDTWGLAHICLQPLVLAGLALIAARWAELGRGWRLAWVAGAAVDFMLGIALQFGVQSFLLDQWFAPNRAPGETLSSYNAIAGANLRAKVQNKWAFFGDGFASSEVMILTVLGALLAIALVRARRRPVAT